MEVLMGLLAQLALNEIIKGGAGELGKGLAGETLAKVNKLGEMIWNRIKGKPEVVAALPGVEQNNPQAVDQLKVQVEQVLQDKNDDFTQEVKKLAEEIHFELTQIEDNSSLIQNNYNNATGFQVKVTGGSPQIGSINNNYDNQK